MTRILRIGALLAAALILLGAGFVTGTWLTGRAAAQDITPPTPPTLPTIPGPAGGWMAQYRDLMHDAVAQALGLTLDQLDAELSAGKTLPQIAEEQGISTDDLWQAMQDGRAAAIAQAVADGVLTQEQADRMLTMQHGRGMFGGRGGCSGYGTEPGSTAFGPHGSMMGRGGMRGWQAPSSQG